MSDWIAAVTMGLGLLGSGTSVVAPQPVEAAPVTPQTTQVEEAAPGDLVTFHFVATTTKGREVANSERRGMPYTVRLGAAGTPATLTESLIGAKPGDTRRTGLIRADVAMPGLKPAQGTSDPMTYRMMVLRVQRTNRS
ncbi:MAG: hypothetical protein AMXMBFR81_11960 [Chthonomonas sp.]